MTRHCLPLVLILCLLLSGCRSTSADPVPETRPIPVTQPAETTAAATLPTTLPIAPPTEPTALPEPVYVFTEEEQEMLLKIGMAERGSAGCTECIALVMRTLLNRMESGRFGSSIRSVLFAEGQFTPISDGSYYQAEPNDLCREALEQITQGWDESQGALFYEWCEGESWHSQNLNLLFQHCDTRFYK